MRTACWSARRQRVSLARAARSLAPRRRRVARAAPQRNAETVGSPGIQKRQGKASVPATPATPTRGPVAIGRSGSTGRSESRGGAVPAAPGDRVDAVVHRMPQPHRVAEAPGSAREVAARAAPRGAAAGRGIPPLDRSRPPRSRIPPATPSGPAHDVHARVDAVAEVDVEVARLAPHRGVARGRPHARVRARVGRRRRCRARGRPRPR